MSDTDSGTKETQEKLPGKRRGFLSIDGVKVDSTEAERVAKLPDANDFTKQTLEKNAQKNWDVFYNRNKNKFYKDRHWGKPEIEEMCSHINFESTISYLEAGCGVGNMLFPLGEWFPHWRFYAYDFSKNAVKMLAERAAEMSLPVTTGVVDLTEETQIPLNSEIDLATLVFVLSGIHPDKHVTAVSNLAKMLKPGGTVVFKDYAAYDHAMMRFKSSNKIQDRFYKRADLTRAFYFFREEVVDIFEQAGFRAVNCYYHHTYTENFKMAVHVERAFLQAVFIKN